MSEDKRLTSPHELRRLAEKLGRRSGVIGDGRAEAAIHMNRAADMLDSLRADVANFQELAEANAQLLEIVKRRLTRELDQAHEARREAQRELARYKELLARSRIDLMRELQEQGWTRPARAEVNGAAQALKERDTYASELAACRDAFPIPEPGSAHEQAWMWAIEDPLKVAAYVRAVLAACQISNP